MEPLVDAQLMEKTWRAVGAMSDAEIRQRQGLCGKEQQELTGFVLAYKSELASEPAVMQYVIDALTEENEDDPVALTDDDFWRILQVLKTVADCMHFARRTDDNAA